MQFSFKQFGVFALALAAGVSLSVRRRDIRRRVPVRLPGRRKLQRPILPECAFRRTAGSRPRLGYRRGRFRSGEHEAGQERSQPDRR